MSLAGRIETAASVAIIVVTVLLWAVLIRAFVLPAPPPQGPQALAEATVGASLLGRVPGVDWRKNGRTLVLAISTQCHFCKESTAFYRRVQEQAAKRLTTVAVLPQAVDEGERFLSSEGVRVDQVKQITLGSIGIRGTPTMLLVNGAGVVTKMWAGKIQPEQEQEVLAALGKG